MSNVASTNIRCVFLDATSLNTINFDWGCPYCMQCYGVKGAHRYFYPFVNGLKTLRLNCLTQYIICNHKFNAHIMQVRTLSMYLFCKKHILRLWLDFKNMILTSVRYRDIIILVNYQTSSKFYFCLYKIKNYTKLFINQTVC